MPEGKGKTIGFRFCAIVESGAAPIVPTSCISSWDRFLLSFVCMRIDCLITLRSPVLFAFFQIVKGTNGILFERKQGEENEYYMFQKLHTYIHKSYRRAKRNKKEIDVDKLDDKINPTRFLPNSLYSSYHTDTRAADRRGPPHPPESSQGPKT